MSEDSTNTGPEVTETVTTQTDQLPDDHPLVKTLALQKAEIKELKTKASRLAQIEDEQKTEAEKAAERIAKAETEVASVPAKVAEALKAHLVSLHDIDGEDAELFLTAVEPDLLIKQVTRLLLGKTDKRRNKNTVTREGTNPTATTNDEAAFARDLLGAGG